MPASGDLAAEAIWHVPSRMFGSARFGLGLKGFGDFLRLWHGIEPCQSRAGWKALIGLECEIDAYSAGLKNNDACENESAELPSISAEQLEELEARAAEKRETIKALEEGSETWLSRTMTDRQLRPMHPKPSAIPCSGCEPADFDHRYFPGIAAQGSSIFRLGMIAIAVQ
jgi:hypothetical protein